LTRSRWLR